MQALASSDDDPQLQALSGSYATVRRFLPALLAGVAFEGTPSAKPLLDAWHFLQAQEAGGRGRPKWASGPARGGAQEVGAARYFRPKAR
ncbi:MAG: hypothetical protein WKG07_38075 [Hymenobacter sp.]